MWSVVSDLGIIEAGVHKRVTDTHTSEESSQYTRHDCRVMKIVDRVEGLRVLISKSSWHQNNRNKHNSKLNTAKHNPSDSIIPALQKS